MFEIVRLCNIWSRGIEAKFVFCNDESKAPNDFLLLAKSCCCNIRFCDVRKVWLSSMLTTLISPPPTNIGLMPTPVPGPTAIALPENCPLALVFTTLDLLVD